MDRNGAGKGVFNLKFFTFPSSLPFIFLLVAFPSLLIFATLVPFGEVADEPAQSVRAEALLSGQFVGHREPLAPGNPQIGAGFNIDSAMVQSALTPQNGDIMVTAVTISQAYQRSWYGERQFMQISPLAIYAPIFYIPAGIGIAVAKLTGIEPYHAGLLARLFNVFTYLTIGAAALLVARHGKAIMLGVLLAPMSLNLGASLNEDGLIIASAVLAASLISRSWVPAEPEDVITPNLARTLAAITMFCICIVKPPYLPLAFTGLLPLRDISRDWSATGRAELFRRTMPIFVTTICVIVWFAWTMATISEPSYFPPRPAGPLLPGVHPTTFSHTDPLWQVRVLVADPLRIITLPVDTFLWNPLWQEMIGVLGWLDIILPKWMYQLWYGSVDILAAGAIVGAVQLLVTKKLSLIRAADSLLVCFLIFAAFIAIYLSQYLVWTNVGAVHVEGPQGRYLLPLVPFLALALPEFKFPSFVKANIFVLVPLAAGFICLAEYPALLLRSYYLH